jgi:hypothetical protein
MFEGRLKEQYEGLKIFVAVPTHDKKLCMNCHSSLMNALQVLLACGIPFSFSYEVGLPYISMARNNLVRKFMESDCTDMVFIDSDVGFAPGAFHDLVISKEELIGGAYPKKCDTEEYAVSLSKNEQGEAIVQNGVIKAEGLATGFMKIKRSAIEKMQAAYPELEYDDGLTNRKTFNFFGEFAIDRRMYYDDFGFCHLWSKLGESMWILPDITFTHAGGKDYKGNLHEYLTKPRPEGIVKAMKVDGFMSEEELTWLYNRAKGMGSVIEVGSWKGRSTTALLEGCTGPVLAVDNWRGHDPASNGSLEAEAEKEDIFGLFKQNTRAYSNLTILEGDSSTNGKSWDKPADMVFIDGEHTYEGCKADIEAWAPKARKLIAFHDYNAAWPGVMRAVNERFGIPEVVGTIAYVELGDK